VHSSGRFGKRRWAAGNATSRARAAAAIRHRWQDPIWQELLPELLDAGITEQSATHLRQGLIPINDATDATGFSKRLTVLQPLLDDARPVVRQFAFEVSRDLRQMMSSLQNWVAATEQP